jgi:ammonia channel protein AmtB
MLKVIDLFTNVKVQAADEVLGLDAALHGEQAYEDVLEPALQDAGARTGV